MRVSCLNCTRKHLSQAIVLLIEAKLGYPEHLWLAIGHLAEAESESVTEYKLLAEKIRLERTRLMDDENYVPELMPLIKIATDIATADSNRVSRTRRSIRQSSRRQPRRQSS